MQTHDPSSDNQFSWDLKGRVVVLDNGGTFPERKNFNNLMELNSFATIVFDPSAKHKDREDLQSLDEFQMFPNVTLGDGSSVTMHACLEQAYSSTLEPKVNSWLSEQGQTKYQVLAKFPISSIALDAIEGLPSVDWLLLDDKHDNVKILEHGGKALASSLAIQVRIPFRPSYQGQSDLAQVSHWMSRNGFRFYCMLNPRRFSHLPSDGQLEKFQSTELLGSDFLFIPTEERIASMEAANIMKLSFILHAAYQFHDICYSLLAHVDSSLAERYLIEQGYCAPVNDSEEFLLTYEYSPDIWDGKI
ncbi:hypothetical protein HOP51_07160 [Halomonas sp. MCCC 1A11036]|uniref:DUF4123 domain-containing protein n=1 Tax=Billgrantia zhangzhouensis TaxID=2733481 RepID=A0ABS9ADS7_9GAMM|nr:hypothetical protein [Halomonas zhangzhouensis]MCE8019893.1 hypothetical protein [Halomonas zhangzhouensis]